MESNIMIFRQGKAFPASFRGISYMLVLISFAFIVHQKLGVLKNPLVWIIYIFFIVVHTGKSYIEVRNIKKGIFKHVTQILMFKFDRTRNIADYKHGIVKVVRQVYSVFPTTLLLMLLNYRGYDVACPRLCI